MPHVTSTTLNKQAFRGPGVTAGGPGVTATTKTPVCYHTQRGVPFGKGSKSYMGKLTIFFHGRTTVSIIVSTNCCYCFFAPPSSPLSVPTAGQQRQQPPCSCRPRPPPTHPPTRYCRYCFLRPPLSLVPSCSTTSGDTL